MRRRIPTKLILKEILRPKVGLRMTSVLLVAFMCIFSSGCWFLIVGGAGAVGGYAVTQDTFQGISSKGQEELLTAAHKVLLVMGTITEERLKDAGECDR